GNLGIGLIFGLLALLALVVGVFIVVAVVQTSFVLALVAIVATILVVGALALVGSAASGIFTASLYRYATKGDPGAAFRPETMSAAFKQKSGGLAARFGRPR
ncbi:MAG: DUF6159 family protein, partial [Candidatus Limnocylindrales bacterium]